jgi:hypothetical protein
MNVQKIIELLEKELKLSWCKDGEEFSSSYSDTIWSGEGATIEIFGEQVEAFNYYGNHKFYTFGVHNALYEWSEKHGIHWEAYDPGTFFAYEN